MTRMLDALAAIEAAFDLPPHIEAAAEAMRFDLNHGPAWLILPGGDPTKLTDPDLFSLRADADDEAGPQDKVVPAFSGPHADMLRAWADENIPSEAWVDLDCDSVSDRPPQEDYEDEDGVAHYADLSNVMLVEASDIRAAIFGAALAPYL